ncbi:MAG: hypothetical protein QOE19_3410 [Actinomycetota bacterium]|nr:hypothetical protein [Actinomycetota bacterium]
MGTGTGSVLLRSLVIEVLAQGASGCSDDTEKPGTIPTPRPTESSTASTPTPTPVEAQVEAAFRAYYGELTRAISTGRTGRLKTTMQPSCPCYRSARSIDKLAAKDQWAPEAQITVISVNVHDVIAKSAAAEVSYDVSAYDLVEMSGKVVSHVPPRKDHVALSLLKVSDRWILANVFNLGGR